MTDAEHESPVIGGDGAGPPPNAHRWRSIAGWTAGVVVVAIGLWVATGRSSSDGSATRSALEASTLEASTLAPTTAPVVEITVTVAPDTTLEASTVPATTVPPETTPPTAAPPPPPNDDYRYKCLAVLAIRCGEYEIYSGDGTLLLTVFWNSDQSNDYIANMLGDGSGCYAIKLRDVYPP